MDCFATMNDEIVYKRNDTRITVERETSSNTMKDFHSNRVVGFAAW